MKQKNFPHFYVSCAKSCSTWRELRVTKQFIPQADYSESNLCFLRIPLSCRVQNAFVRALSRIQPCTYKCVQYTTKYLRKCESVMHSLCAGVSAYAESVMFSATDSEYTRTSVQAWRLRAKVSTLYYTNQYPSHSQMNGHFDWGAETTGKAINTQSQMDRYRPKSGDAECKHTRTHTRTHTSTTTHHASQSRDSLGVLSGQLLYGVWW